MKKLCGLKLLTFANFEIQLKKYSCKRNYFSFDSSCFNSDRAHCYRNGRYLFLGKIGKTEQAACILSNNLYILLLVFSIGMSYALTPAVTDAHVRESDREKASLFKNSLFVNKLVSVFLFLILFSSSPLLAYMQQPEDVVKLAIPFFNVLIFSIIPVTLFFVCKQYSEGLSNTKAAMYISVIGNVINVILNYVLINGKMGLPEMGYMGSCWASFIARLLWELVLWYLFLKTNI